MSVKAKMQRARARLQNRIQRKTREGLNQFKQSVKPKYIGGGLGKLDRIKKADLLYKHNNKALYLKSDLGMGSSSIAVRQQLYNQLHNKPVFETGQIIISELNKKI
jgi:hypothetical protein